MPTSNGQTVKRANDAASQTDRAVLALREILLRGDFAPGQRLTELALAARLGASRTPVRHALNRLAHEGLLEALPAGGFSGHFVLTRIECPSLRLLGLCRVLPRAAF